MMDSLRRFVVGLVACVAMIFDALPARADSFSVEQWDLSVSVYRAWPDLAGHSFMTVLNPFVNQHAVALPSNPATLAAAQYDISWLVNYGDFNISAQLAAQDGNSVRSQASGTIYLQSDVDLTLHASASFEYSLPAYGMSTDILVHVRDLTLNQDLLGQGASYATFIDPPGTGNLAVEGTTVLPAGHDLYMEYLVRIHTYGYSASLPTADGFVNFTISPEPASLALLAPLLAVAVRRRGETPRLQ